MVVWVNAKSKRGPVHFANRNIHEAAKVRDILIAKGLRDVRLELPVNRPAVRS